MYYKFIEQKRKKVARKQQWIAIWHTIWAKILFLG